MFSTRTSSSKHSKKMLNGSSGPSAQSHPLPEISTSVGSSTASTSSDDWLKAAFNEPHFVAVLWGDAHCTGDASWTESEELKEAAENPPTTVLTTGVLVHSSATHLAVISTIIEDGSHGGQVHVIPRGMINSVKDLT